MSKTKFKTHTAEPETPNGQPGKQSAKAENAEAANDQDSNQDEAQEVDWKEAARKWETRAKRNHKRISSLEEEIKQLAESKDQAVAEAVRPLQGQIDQFRQENQMRDWKKTVSEKTGVPTELLRGQSLEELQAHGDALAKYYSSATKGPVVKDAGDTPKRGAVSDLAQTARALFGSA